MDPIGSVIVIACLAVLVICAVVYVIDTIRIVRRALLAGRGVATYAEKVLSYGPIAYWPLWETAGVTAQCLVNSPAQDARYVGYSLNEEKINKETE